GLLSLFGQILSSPYPNISGLIIPHGLFLLGCGLVGCCFVSLIEIDRECAARTARHLVGGIPDGAFGELVIVPLIQDGGSLLVGLDDLTGDVHIPTLHALFDW